MAHCPLSIYFSSKIYIVFKSQVYLIFPGGSGGKEFACKAGDPGMISGSGRDHSRRPTPGLLPGKSRGQKSLVDYTSWDHKESDTTEQLTHTHTHNKNTTKG